MVKLLMGWNIVPGRENEYFDFVVQEFEPGLADLGLQTTDVWFTAYGDWPQIVTGTVASDMETMRKILASEQWRRLKERLLEYVTDYQQKVILANGGYQL
ncbi:MAG TPA: hypothetical protein ENK08_10920 [Chloroflexi bacterium]|nr:hypothetical protein [Chloroflexota bacterium]